LKIATMLMIQYFKMNLALSSLMILVLVSGVISKPTLENDMNDETLQQIKEVKAENEELREKLALVEAEQINMKDLIQQLRRDYSFGSENYSDTTEVQEIYDIKFTFPRQESTADWVKYIRPVPRMEEFTMCFWISPEDIKNPYVVSYARSSDYNHFSVQIVDENTLRVWVDSSYYYDFKGFKFDIGQKVHLCVSLTLYSNVLTVYENGAFKERRDVTHSTSHILGDGTLIFGQDQDNVGGGFHSSEAYKGEISDFIIWPRTLSAMEVRGVANSCSYPKDYIIRPQMTNIEWSGNVFISIDNVCPATTV